MNIRRPFFSKIVILKFRLRVKKYSFVKGHFTLSFSVYLPTGKKIPDMGSCCKELAPLIYLL